MTTNQFLLYGANGYTARLILEKAALFGLTPVLAGRSEAKLRPLAEQHGLTYRVADLNDHTALDRALADLPVVLHCAGPFSQTAAPMQEACLRTRTHYLDITGEVAVFEHGQTLDRAAKEQNILLMSGVGFDVVPTDCIARYLHEQLPDATHLQLAFLNDGGGISHGTAQTALENAGAGSLIRQNGRLVSVPTAHKTLTIDFGVGEPRSCMSIPWGDLSTAYHTTGIPNIDTFIGSSAGQIRLAKAGNLLGGLLKNRMVQNFLRQQLTKRISGPNEVTRQHARTHVWGRVTNAGGQTIEARLHGPEGYTLTAEAALLITKKVMAGQWQAGYQTPAGLYGADLILEIPNVTRMHPTPSP
ncbi:saccharopine dehydrogenase family protein [Spirosoma montaniterrae]|uniref:Saccharopine dehydrogenase n=1 Tax=Spirosoma montaniterrae TaxID=1178516 RepID=A0A1P9X0G8_9BACT|nr:saccharopine dehydrogenase NADP-binding domain-containing protein [Spirosoma montaniterrae]AQG81098.1 saccharopine dehydrogenase [Spirosoma montaniterrae]